MAHPVISLFDAGSTAFRFDMAPAGPPRPVEAVITDVRAATAAGAPWIVLPSPEPTSHPHLLDIVDAAHASGARVKMTSLGIQLAEKGTLEKLRDAGLAQLTLVLYGGVAATHDARVGTPGAFDAAVEALVEASSLNRLLTTVRMVLLDDNHTETGSLVQTVRERADWIELVRLSALTRDVDLLRARGVRRSDALAATQAAWEASRVGHTRLFTEAFGTWPDIPLPSDTPLQPVDGTLLDMLRAHVPVPSTRNGTWATPLDGDPSGLWFAVEESRSLAELGLQLAAYGCPALDLPPSLGGLSLDHPPGEDAEDRIAPRRREGVPMLLANTFDVDARPLPAWEGVGRSARVHVVDGFLTDNVLALSSLPALAEALAAKGAEVTLHSVWKAPTNPYDPGDALPHTVPVQAERGWRYPEGLGASLATVPQRYAHARRAAPAWLKGLDLSGADLVIAPGFDNAFGVWTNPTFPEAARLVVPDFHMLTGVSGWHTRYGDGPPMAGGWWPDERILVEALYPRYVRSYWRAGVPMRQLGWHPYPLHTGHFPEGPDVTTCDTIFAGGTHMRDWRTLARAATLLPAGTRPLRIHTADAVPAPLEHGGEVPLLDFYTSIATSRFVVLPLDADPRRPAGISVISMALAAGRPVIASATLATIDHLRHGHNAILVPPGRPRALARAIERLDQDDALLTQLAAGARSAATHLSVDAWATRLLDGRPAQTVFTMDGEPHGPFHAWPA